MRAAPVLQAAWAGAARRLVQSLVVLAVLAVSCAAALTGLTLDAAANAGILPPGSRSRTARTWP